MLDESGLSPRLRRRVLRIARRTRLRRGERLLIAEMLAGEAMDRLERGETEQQILRSLRPVRRLARQLRKESLRRAPLRRMAWWYLSLTKRSVLTALAALAIVYPYFFWKFHTGKTLLTRNISGERNARWTGVADSELAADLYRAAYEAMEKLTGSERGTLDREWPNIFPGDPLWPEALGYLERNQHAIKIIREAGERPHAGFILSLQPHLIRGPEQSAEPVSGAGGNPPALDLVIDSLGPYRSFARLLSVDARAGAEAGDAPRCTANLLALLNLARHAEEHECLIGDLVSIAILDLCSTTLGDVLAHHPDLLTRGQLETLADAFRAFRGGEIHANLGSERDLLDDITQRMYTDNGNGDGRLCADGLRRIDLIAGGDGRLGASGFILGPINAAFLPSRREFTAKYTTALTRLEELSSAPLWEWRQDPIDVVNAELFSGTVETKRFLALSILLPPLGKAISAHEFASQHRDAALAMIGCTLYRIDHSGYPGSIGELVPEYLPELPLDRYDGGPIKLAFDDTGMPILYSVGADRADNRGAPREFDEQGDEAMRWFPPGEAGLLPPGDWILLPIPRPEPYEDE